MDNDRKKALKSEYAEREVIGGVYLVRNTLNNKALLDTATDLKACKNRFEFALTTGSCVYPKLQQEWSAQGGRHFTLEVLEELSKGETQTQAEYKSDLEFLKDIWLEKLTDEELY